MLKIFLIRIHLFKINRKSTHFGKIKRKFSPKLNRLQLQLKYFSGNKQVEIYRKLDKNSLLRNVIIKLKKKTITVYVFKIIVKHLVMCKNLNIGGRQNHSLNLTISFQNYLPTIIHAFYFQKIKYDIIIIHNQIFFLKQINL